jgi:hypothetical protein
MTPEQLARIPGMMDEYLPMIQSAVLGYYGQFEAAVLAAQPGSADSEGKAPAHDPQAHQFPSNFGQAQAEAEPAAEEVSEAPAESSLAMDSAASAAEPANAESESIPSEDVLPPAESSGTTEETEEAL